MGEFMRWKGIYTYYIFIAAVLIAFIADQSTVAIPAWGGGLGVLFLIWVAIDQSWQAFKKQGRAGILVSLKPSQGGHSTIHPDDISIAMSRKENERTFMVFATGGFVYGGIEWQGSENFVICPPEHIESTGPAFICHTKLRRVEYERLPDYIQIELDKLKLFNKQLVKAKQNLWFGMTSKIDDTATTENLQIESKFLDQTNVINYLKTLLKDKSTSVEAKRKEGEQIVVNLDRK